MLVTICSFLLPSGSGEKVTINGFSLVGSLLYLVYFGNTLPFHEVNVPIVGMYIKYIFQSRCSTLYVYDNIVYNFVSVILYANHAALTGIAILLNTVCLRMVREEKINPPPRFFKFMFKRIVVKALGLSEYEVSIYHSN